MTIRKYSGRYWALYDDTGELVCVCLYQQLQIFYVFISPPNPTTNPSSSVLIVNPLLTFE
jgi:hypothetical protein